MSRREMPNMILFGVYSLILFGIAFAAGRESQPYRWATNLPTDTYDVVCKKSNEKGTIFSLVTNTAGEVKLVGYDKNLPASFEFIAGQKAHDQFGDYAPRILDTTAKKPVIFWTSSMND